MELSVRMLILVIGVCLTATQTQSFSIQDYISSIISPLYYLPFYYPVYYPSYYYDKLFDSSSYNNYYQNVNFTKTFCYYLKNESYLICSGPVKTFKCEAISNLEKLNMTHDQIAYGFSLVESADSLPENAKLLMYPRDFQQEMYLDSEFLFENKTANMSIWYSDKINDFGLKIKDLKCFEELISSVKVSEPSELVLTNLNNRTVKFYGGLMVSDDLKSMLVDEASYSYDY